MGTVSDMIKTMKLYTGLDRVANELAELGYDRCSGPIEAADVHKVTMMNYSGVDGCRNVVETLKLGKESRVLDVGCGFGGPARVISQICGCQTTGVEMQSDVRDIACLLTARCGLDDKVSLLHADATDDELISKTGTGFDGLVSWLTILHIHVSERTRVWKNANKALRSGGMIYVEDFYCDEPEKLSEEQKGMLARDVYIPEGLLPTRDEYVRTLEEAGFTNIRWSDETQTWRGFVEARRQAYADQKERHLRVHNEEIFNQMDYFNTTVSSLFSHSPLRGVRIVAEKK
ncbi:Sarcosine/dimethylglycine N-methyltransferase [Diplonema papillatum]|nr:Sarcosine/dimethylglycine N-methyltransferase [Diplonema papillatum]|eukprot:gene15804-24143_t